MKKLFMLYFSFVLVVSLSGCFDTNRNVKYIKPDLREISYTNRLTGDPDTISGKKYEIMIDGYWYPADENGELTPAGKVSKQNREIEASGGGGGC
tara:strand:- start:125 stop:409 length:285 start_codon:yes stop_codon:yes gene_type:complete